MSFRDIVAAMMLFVDGVNGNAALRLRRDLHCDYKTAFVLLHKFRVAMADMQADHMLTGEVEIDGVQIGGHIRKANLHRHRKPVNAQAAKKRRTIVTIRERRRGGHSRAFVLPHETHAFDKIVKLVKPDARIVTDEASHWDRLVLVFDYLPKRVNHTIGHSIDGIHINMVENQHSRIRRAQRGVYLNINGTHAQAYADELSWRDDRRETDNGRQFLALLQRASKLPVSKAWVGYWQGRPRMAQAVA
jgi:hypothetical protein